MMKLSTINAFKVEMRLRGISYETQKSVQVKYKGDTVGTLFADIFVWRNDEQILIEFEESDIIEVHCNYN